MIVGCYSLDLYCVHERLPIVFTDEVPVGSHRHGEFPHTFDAPNEATCRKQARARGWRFINGDVLCPRCAGAKMRKTI